MKLISKIIELYCLFPVPEEGTISKNDQNQCEYIFPNVFIIDNVTKKKYSI